MSDLAERFENNPIFKPEDIKPSLDDFEVAGVFNPGAFEYNGKFGLLMRVAERPRQTEETVSTPVIDPQSENGVKIIKYDKDDPDLTITDTRGFKYKGKQYLTTLSHFRLAWSDDGIHFKPDDKPAVTGEGHQESYGIEDPRVARIGDRYYITYTAVSADGFGIGLMSTDNWVTFNRHGIILAPPNKDCALFPQKFGTYYVAMHRPSPIFIGDNNIWIARSPDMYHWGSHKCLIKTREDSWDDERIGAGAEPFITDKGWLAIYHGADKAGKYSLGAMLLDFADPSVVLARSEEPIMEPTQDYETKGFYANVIFTNGQVVKNDEIYLYYGAADTVIAGAKVNITDILDTLKLR